MNVVKSFALAFVFSGLLWPLGAKSLERNPDSVIKTYVSAEKQQDYPRVYLLLSNAMKARLKKENAINDASDYARLRRSSEAHWLNFFEKSRQQSEVKAVVNFEVLIEENGEREKTPVTIKLLLQGDKWRIDAIDY